MSLLRNSAIVVAATLTLAGAAAAETLVIRAAGPSAKSFPPGRKLPDGAAVALKAGDQITLLDGRGTRVVRGPVSFVPGAAATPPETGARLAALVGGGSDRRVRIGAVRGGVVTLPRSPSIWYVDASQGGTVCVPDPAAVTLWRPDASAPALLTVERSGGASTRIPWAAGASTLAWPAAVPVAQGAGYVVTMPGSAGVSLRFVFVGARPQGMEDTAGLLIRSGCTTQLDLLVDTFSLPDPAAAPAG